MGLTHPGSRDKTWASPPPQAGGERRFWPIQDWESRRGHSYLFELDRRHEHGSHLNMETRCRLGPRLEWETRRLLVPHLKRKTRRVLGVFLKLETGVVLTPCSRRGQGMGVTLPGTVEEQIKRLGSTFF